MTSSSRDAAPATTRTTLVGAAASLAVLLACAPSPTAAVDVLSPAAAGPDAAAPLLAVVALAAWALSCWLAVGVALVLLGRAPGLLGRAGSAVASCVVPPAVRRVLEAALGVTVVLGALSPTTALAQMSGGAGGVVAPAAAAGEPQWDLDWPDAAARTPPVQVQSPAPAPAPLPSRAPAREPQPAPVVVRQGDTLWALAEDGLRRAGTARPTDGQVARAWPRWWAANREVIGADPDLLRPGTVLRPPT